MKVTIIDWITLILVIVGALNWGLVGLLNLDLVAAVFGAGAFLAKLAYILVGVSGLYILLFLLKKLK